MKVAAIMPCRGRAEQTRRNLLRLKQAAGMPFQLIAVTHEEDVRQQLRPLDFIVVDHHPGRLGYWVGMAAAMSKLADGVTHIVNLANDLLPGREWLRRGAEAYERRFATGPGLMGFNEGIHGPELSPHFMISIELLRDFGGWPTWYKHNYGDLELCTRAQEQGRYGKAAWALLYHDHHLTGAALDQVYAEGSEHHVADRKLFESRRYSQWTTFSSFQS